MRPRRLFWGPEASRSISMDDLVTDCTRFREAILAADRSRLIVSLRDFPCGSCDDTSLLLARYLKERGHGDFRSISGRRGQETHVWLKQGKLVIDLTGSQFDDWPHELVYIGEECSWFASFFGVDGGSANYRQFGGSVEVELDASYAEIVSHAV